MEAFEWWIRERVEEIRQTDQIEECERSEERGVSEKSKIFEIITREKQIGHEAVPNDTCS